MSVRKKLLLVGWDAADWKIIHPLIDAGKLPGVAHLVENGVSGNIATLEPHLSPMLWTSIATGKMAYHHGVAGFTEVDPLSRKVVPVSAASRKARTLWEMLGERGLRSHVVSWFATHGERDMNGCMVSNMYCHTRGAQANVDPTAWPPSPPGTFWPESLGAILDPRRISIHDLDGDQIIRMFVPEAHRVDQQQDSRLRVLGQHLAEAFSVHEAATHLLASEPDWDFMAVYYRAIDEVSHHFMHYHPPRMDSVPAADFELYQHVVTGVYRLHDLFLQRLIALAGPDTTVILVSDHGFHNDHLRPRFTPDVPAGIMVWHRPYGVFAAAGPGLRKDEMVYGANLLDLAPTILHHLGLPVGADMEGRVLEDIFDAPRAVETIPTWEPPAATVRPRVSFSDHDEQALLDQFQALGYIDELPGDAERAIAQTQRENDWNMARACLHGGRLEAALPLLEACFHAAPERTDFAQALARCQLRLGLLDEADATIAIAEHNSARTEQADLVRASLAIHRGDAVAALSALERVRNRLPDEIEVHLLLARAYMRLGRWQDAAESAEAAVSRDPDNARGYLLLARAERRLGNARAAVDYALQSIGLQFGNPFAHVVLGRALMDQGLHDAAANAFGKALALDATDVDARRGLAEAHRRSGHIDLAAEEDATAARHAEQARAERQSRTAATRAFARQRAEQRATEAAARAAADTEHTSSDRAAEAAGAAAAGSANASAGAPGEFLIVSGLPRSGTSLMMQILRAGGIEPMTDSVRVADEDNPEGYWEWEAIRQLPRQPAIIDQARGKAVKVISALLPALPEQHRYTVIYMCRPIEEVVDSQIKMLARNGQAPGDNRSRLIDLQVRHSQGARRALAANPRVRLIEVSYPDLVQDPAGIIGRLAAILPGFVLDPSVLACVKPRLHRNRVAQSEPA